MQTEPSWWFRAFEVVKGNLANLKKLGLDAVEDHGMNNYLEWLAKNQAAQPLATVAS